MTISPSLLPAMVTIPAGVFSGVAIESFRLGRTPVTNAEYAAHVDRFQKRPFVLMTTTATCGISIVARGKSPEHLVGPDWKKWAPKDWDTSDPHTFGALALFELRKDTSGELFDRPDQPVVNVSWFHAFEYCASNGLFLPSDDQWEYAARGPEGHDYGTKSGKITKEEAHYPPSDATADVGYYPPNDFGLLDMTGNVWEWTARNDSEDYPYGLRGGSWRVDHLRELRAIYRLGDLGDHVLPTYQSQEVGFRVAADLR